MAEISLRAYLNRLDALLKTNAADEVIHHCRHILQHYPKNVMAYRSLGRALLINGRWDEAGAAFRRVLSVIPDDQTANAGLSEVYDHLRKPDEAIYHAERAYEQDPNRAETLDLIRGLYRRYRGIETARVQLTSSALARQSLRNRQYGQALETLRGALSRMPDRIDLKLLLARTLWEMENHVEAAEAALDVHEKLPDCLDANRILTQLWLNVDRPSDAQKYLNRIEAVDPYLALELATGITSDDMAFRIEELDYRTAAQSEMASARPDWLQDISLTGNDEFADWTNPSGQKGTNVLVAQTGALPISGPLPPLPTSSTGMLNFNKPAEASAADDLGDDDWMKAALNQPLPATGSLAGTPSAAAADADADELPPDFNLFGDLPPGTGSLPVDPLADDVPAVSGFDDDPMAWLREAGIEVDDTPTPSAGQQAGSEDLADLFADPAPAAAADSMDWLNSYGGEYLSDEAAAQSTPAAADDDFADLFADPAPVAADLFVDPAADRPATGDLDWLGSFDAADPDETPVNPPAAVEPAWLTGAEQDATYLDEAFGLEALTTERPADRPADDDFTLNFDDLYADSPASASADAPVSFSSAFPEPTFDAADAADPFADLYAAPPAEPRLDEPRFSTAMLNWDDSPDPLDQDVKGTDHLTPMIEDSAPPVTDADLADLFGEFSTPADAPAAAKPHSDEEALAAASTLPSLNVDDADWLNAIAQESSSGVPGPRRGLTAMLQDTDFDWSQEADAAEAGAVPLPTTGELSSELGDWLAQFDPPAEAKPTDEPAWLADLNAPADPAPSSESVFADVTEPEPLAADADPSWLAALDPTGTTPEAAEPLEDSQFFTEGSLSDVGESFEWFAPSADAPPAAPAAEADPFADFYAATPDNTASFDDVLPTADADSAAADADIPDWLRDLEAEQTGVAAEPEPPAVMDTDPFGDLYGEPVAETADADPFGDLYGEPVAETADTDPDAPAVMEETPDWLLAAAPVIPEPQAEPELAYSTADLEALFDQAEAESTADPVLDDAAFDLDQFAAALDNPIDASAVLEDDVLVLNDPDVLPAHEAVLADEPGDATLAWLTELEIGGLADQPTDAPAAADALDAEPVSAETVSAALVEDEFDLSDIFSEAELEPAALSTALTDSELESAMPPETDADPLADPTPETDDRAFARFEPADAEADPWLEVPAAAADGPLLADPLFGDPAVDDPAFADPLHDDVGLVGLEAGSDQPDAEASEAAVEAAYADSAFFSPADVAAELDELPGAGDDGLFTPDTAEPVELVVRPADNAPDWLNAMVPGLDVDYTATEDAGIETEFIQMYEDATPAEQYDADAAFMAADAPLITEPAAGGYGWLIDIVDEESEQLVPAAAIAAGAAAPRFRFMFTRRPLWYKETNGTSTSDDVPEWLR